MEVRRRNINTRVIPFPSIGYLILITRGLANYYIYRCFNEVLNSLEILHTKYVNLPCLDYLTEKIKTNRKFYSFFQDYIRALDSTHVLAFIPTLS
jgi:hypothetical protein